MPININPSSALATMISGSSAVGGETGNGIYRGRYTEHFIQVKGSSGAVNFTLQASASTDTWTTIRDQADVDTTAQSYDNTTPNAILTLSGSYPWLRMIRGTGSTGSEFTAWIFSNGNPED